MIDVTFLPLLFTMSAPPSWLPSEFFPSMSQAAWSSTSVIRAYNSSNIGLIDTRETREPFQISRANPSSVILQKDDDVAAILEQMFLRSSLIAQLESFSNLPINWAGNETKLPSKKTITSAKTLLSSLSSDQVLPQVSPSADGEIGFTWIMGELRFEALLYPDNHLVWLWSHSGDVNPGGEGPYNGSFPSELLDKIAVAAA